MSVAELPVGKRRFRVLDVNDFCHQLSGERCLNVFFGNRNWHRKAKLQVGWRIETADDFQRRVEIEGLCSEFASNPDLINRSHAGGDSWIGILGIDPATLPGSDNGILGKLQFDRLDPPDPLRVGKQTGKGDRSGNVIGAGEAGSYRALGIDGLERQQCGQETGGQ